MPLYEYECKSCGNRFEKIQKFSDPLVTECPKCGKQTVEQMISAPAFQFKGSGWYVSDYGNKKSGGDSAANSDSASGGDGKTDAKSDAKSAAGSGSKAESATKSKSGEAKPGKSGGAAAPSSAATTASSGSESK